MENSFIDLIIRLKNGYLAKKETIDSPYSKLKENILKKLLDLKFIKSYQVIGDKVKYFNIDLLYKDNIPAVNDVKVYSKLGRRYYVSYKNLKPVLSNYGVSILSTNKGILTNKEAQELKVGGELLFSIW